MVAGGAAGAARRTRCQGFVHDALDGARAAAALRAAAEAAVDVPGPSRAGGVDGAAHIMVAEDVAGADDHSGDMHFLQMTAVDLRQTSRRRKVKRLFGASLSNARSCCTSMFWHSTIPSIRWNRCKLRGSLPVAGGGQFRCRRGHAWLAPAGVFLSS